MYENYARIRDNKGLKDIDVSRGTGIAPSTLSDWKAGRTTPKADKLLLIARFLGTTIEAIMETAVAEPVNMEVR